MTRSPLMHEIETLLGLSSPQAGALWQAARLFSRSGAASSAYPYHGFVGGVFVATPAAAGPVPVPYPNASAAGSGGSAGQLFRFNLDLITETKVQPPAFGFFTGADDMIRCVLAVAGGPAAEKHAQVIWPKTRSQLELQPAPVRNALGRQLLEALQKQARS
jgi:hypothetical protein